MSNKTIGLSEVLNEYLLANSLREPEIFRRLREETAADPMARMQIAPEQGQFMAMLTRLTGARRALEIGVFTGYSALSVVSAMPDDAYLLACDINKDWTDIARRYWAEAGVADRIDLHLAPALDTLDKLLAEPEITAFDLAFIDADKENYLHYYERVLQLLRPGGLVLIDNVLWSGSVVDETDQDADTIAIREFNAFVKTDQRVWISMVPIADGLMLAMKK